ncbi:MAG: UDP-N-acetylglucosamine--N-acetylmuramyl-(pentapeptide) pyrophosphoryl-undecaprenol N-acetylglucosamine transferase [Phycisphaerales bacterium]
MNGVGPPPAAPSALTRVYLFAGGGTGGHIFPGLAIAEQLAELDRSSRCVFLCSDRPLDSEILRREGVPFAVIPAKPLSLRPAALARFVWSWGGAVRAARAAIRDARRGGASVVVIAMGGFVSAPAVRAASAERVPVTLVNLDALPGMANRWIARRADRVFTSASVTGRDWTAVPPIVRRAARTAMTPGECRRSFGLQPDWPTLLVTGASQGAASINGLLHFLVSNHPEAFRGWQVIHQTGPGGEDVMDAAYERARVPAAVHAFIDAMGPAWGSAELAVSRSGAGSVAEAWANAIPTVFMPYPYHRDEHQRVNARPLEEAGAAVVARDLIEPAANAGAAGAAILRLMGDAARRAAMRAAFASLDPADGAERIARALAAKHPV